VNDWQGIDDLILQRRILNALQAIRERTGCGLRDALAAMSERYEFLRACRPDEFAVSEAEYWEGFYS
jgi:hypothetical protein